MVEKPSQLYLQHLKTAPVSTIAPSLAVCSLITQLVLLPLASC